MSEWKNFRIKDCGVEYNGATPSSKVSLYWDGSIAWITPADMDDFGYISAGNTYISQEGYDSCGTHMLPVGSIVISSRAPIGKIAITTAPLCTNQGCKSLVPRGINTKFLAYSLYSSKDKISLLGQGTTFIELSTKALLAFDIQVPSLSEQKKIADYLDEKTAAIDTQVSLLEQKAKKYEQLKKSLISHAVTRGLNKDVRLKESGIDWIGQIPEHWEVKRFKYFGRTIKGKSLDYYDEPFNGSDIVLSVETLRQDTPTFYNYAQTDDSEQLCTTDDIVVIWDGAGVGEFLKAKNGILSSTIAKLKIDEHKMLKRYFWFWGGNIEYRLKSIPTGMGIPHLNPTLLNNYRLPIPPLSEQQAIADYLDKKTAEIDAAIANINQQIEKYKLLRRALINEVVTGQRAI